MSRSLGVAALFSLATLALVYGAVERGRTVRANRALRDLPHTTRAVVRLDAAALREAAAKHAVIESLLPLEGLDEIERTCGFDPVSDLREAILWVRGTEGEPLEAIGLLLEGEALDGDRMARCHKRLAEARGDAVVRVDAPTGPLLATRGRGSAIALLGTHTVVTGSVTTVTEVMAVHRGLLPALEQRRAIEEIWSEVAADAVAAAAIDPPDHWKEALLRVPPFDANASTLVEIEAIGVSLRSSPVPHVELLLDVTTAAGAAEVAALLEAWSESPPEALAPHWDRWIRSSRVTVDGRRARVRVPMAAPDGATRL